MIFHEPPRITPEPWTSRVRANWRARMSVVGIVVALLAGSTFYRLLADQQLEHTSLVFLGIPAVLAITMVLTAAPQSATGLICLVIVLALCLSSIVLGEAFVCILFASPLFFAVGIIIGRLVDAGRERRRRRALDLRTLLFLALVVTPASLEGVLPGFEFPRSERVTVQRIVSGTVDDVRTALAQTPRFDRGLPLFLQLGFPRPGTTSGSGLERGATRRIQLLHGHHPGTLVLTVRESESHRIVFEIASDDSYIVHWLSWTESEVSWREATNGMTEITWTLSYRRRLDPAWYFKPLERHGVTLAAGYLIDTLATPGGVR